MIRQIRRAGLAALTLLLLAGTADATVRMVPFRVRLADPARLPVAGVPYSNTLILEAVGDVVYTDVRLVGDAWSPRLRVSRTDGVLAAGGTLALPMEVVPTDGAEPLILELLADGKPFSVAIELSPERLARQRSPGRLRLMGGVVSDGVDANDRTAPIEPFPSSGRTELRPDNDRPPGVDAPRNVRVRGRLVYEREDGTFVGADGVWVHVFDTDNLFGDNEVASEVTQSDGDFDLTFSWDATCFLCEQVDIKVRFDTENSEIKTRANNVFASPYQFVTDTETNFSGTDLNLGSLAPDDEDLMPALHIHTDMTRNWRWYDENRNLDLPQVDAIWPDGEDGAFYVPVLEEIHISTGREWREDTHAHEYGHHFVATRAVSVTPDYCNDVCDDDPNAFPPSCGHCQWCRETDHDAYAEGFPNYLAHLQTTGFASRYGIAAMNTRDQESVLTCQEDDLFDSATTTEGFIGAVMQDIWDSANDNDPNGLGDAALRDRLSLGFDEILDVADFDAPTTPLGFLNDFKARFPQHTNLLWETARNNRFDLDTQLPSPVTNLASTDHVVNVGETDATLSMSWTRAADDWSGVQGYSIHAVAAASLPDQTTEVGDVTSFTTTALAPGTWFICVRTLDRDGNWDNGFAQAGPFVILPPPPANLRPQLAAGWDAPFVPRRSNNATAASVPFPATLKADDDSTFWNLSVQNNGGVSVPSGTDDGVWVDGTFVHSSSHASVPAGATHAVINKGPITVSGGHHAIAGFADTHDEASESDETDNLDGTQYVWQPVAFTGSLTRPAPPDRDGGWDQITTSDGFFNADGLRFTHTGITGNLWRAVWAHAGDIEDDYDVRLHAPSSGADNGFTTNAGFSSRDAGCTDAVLVRRAGTLVDQTWDVGFLNQSDGTSALTAQNESASNVNFGSTVTVPLGTGDMFAMRSLSMAVTDTGHVSVTARVVSGRGPVYVAWFPGTFTSGDLLDATATVPVDSGGLVRIELGLSTTATSAVAFYRDPKDGTAPVSIELSWGRTPPDFLTATPAGWHGSVVPRPASDASSSSVPLPDTLHGNTGGTRLNFASTNNSPVAFSGQARHQVLVDDAALSNQTVFLQSAGATFTTNNFSSFLVRGGRHTLTWELDTPDTVEERFETNNTSGEQFVWSPQALPLLTVLTRAQPPVKSAGWDEVDTGEPLYFNCDGMRTPLFASSGQNGFWGAVAVMPLAPASDVDVRLHELSGGAKNGFRTNLGLSSFGPGESDFSLVNFRTTAFRRFDAGVLGEVGGGSYSVVALNSTFRSAAPNGLFGPFTQGASRWLDLHEVTLGPGVYGIELFNASGEVDWGVSLHGLTTFHTKSSMSAGAWLNGPGEDELMNVNVTTAGNYCIAVWKSKSTDLAASGSYRLQIHPLTVDVAGGAVARTAFSAAYPNPFRPHTTLDYELAQPQHVALEIYDVNGARVRTLARGFTAAGRHHATWRGEDDGGRALAPGVYFARLRAGALDERRKVIKLE